MPSLPFEVLKEELSTHFRPWQRSFQFWVRAADIYTGYKVFQCRVNFVKDAKKPEEMWERQHEVAAESVRSREIPRQNPNIANYNGRTRSSRSSIVVTNEVSVRRGRGVPIQAEDAALAFKLQREEFMEAFTGIDEQSRTTLVSSTRGTDEQSRTSSVSSTRADIRARALRAISLRSGQPM